MNRKPHKKGSKSTHLEMKSDPNNGEFGSIGSLACRNLAGGLK